MPDDDLTFGQLLFRVGGGRTQRLRDTIASLGIEPRRIGSATMYSQEQVKRIVEAHRTPNGKDLRKSGTGTTR